MISPAEARKVELAMEEYTERYRHLLREVAQTVGVDPAQFVETQTLVINGINIAFVHYGPFDPDHLTCCMELGDVSDGSIVEAYRTLLEQTVLSGAGASFGLLPESGRPAFLLRLKLDADLTCAKILAVVEQFIFWFAESFPPLHQSSPA